MSEFNAALGLLQLNYIDEALSRRAALDAHYRNLLSSVPGIRCVPGSGETVRNHGYFPILVETEYPLTRDALYDKLKARGYYARRYFYPLISDFPMYRGFPSARRDNLPVASQLAERVLCLPIFPALDQQTVEDIVAIIAE